MDGNLGERDVSKPKVADIVRNARGQVEKLVVKKGATFRKKLEVPVERIESVGPPAHSGGSSGEVTIDTQEGELDALKAGGAEALPSGRPAEPPEVDDVFEELEDAPPTEAGMRRREGRNALARDATGTPGGDAALSPQAGRIRAVLR